MVRNHREIASRVRFLVPALMATLAGCSTSESSTGGGPAAVCGLPASTGDVVADECISKYCCDSLAPCWNDGACKPCIAGGGASCETQPAFAAFSGCVESNHCFGGGGTGGAPDGGTGGAGGTAGGGGTGGVGGTAGAGGTGTSPECAVDADCTAGVPATTPANCALGKCDTAAGECSVAAKDADNDGHAARDCASSDPGVAISLGDDCDDGDANVHPGAWDGPKDPADPTNKPDRCNDGIDQNCSGADGDMVASDGATCECKPGDTSTCSEDSGGIPITWPLGEPKGECRYGVKTCALEGSKPTWGECVGAVPPKTEFCNGGLDEDCRDDGDVLAPDRPAVCPDTDGDNWCLLAGCVQSSTCEVPSGTTMASVCAGKSEPDLCDGDPSRNPGISETCDGIDNNCNALTDEYVTNKYWHDDDDDGHAPTGVNGVEACSPPQVCPVEDPTCAHPDRWKLGLTPDDCNDRDASAHPGLQDAPLCDGKDHDCNGSPNTGCGCTSGVTQTCYEAESNVCNKQVITCSNGQWPVCPTRVIEEEWCPDADGDAHCSTACQPSCTKPAKLAGWVGDWKLGCAKDDCRDDLSWAFPGAPETCGDAVNANCDPGNSDSDGYNVNLPCSAGPPNTACYREGKHVCSGSYATMCNAVAGTPDNNFHATPAPNGSWDWSCDGNVETSRKEWLNANNCAWTDYTQACHVYNQPLTLAFCSNLAWTGSLCSPGPSGYVPCGQVFSTKICNFNNWDCIPNCAVDCFLDCPCDIEAVQKCR